MNLLEHARRELELSGQTDEDPAYAASILGAVEAFVSYGHSGGSAAVAVEQLGRLLRFQPLSPLTSDPADWEDRSEMSGTPLWQNVRDPAVFSTDGGKTWRDVRAADPSGPLTSYSAAQDAVETLREARACIDPDMAVALVEVAGCYAHIAELPSVQRSSRPAPRD